MREITAQVFKGLDFFDEIGLVEADKIGDGAFASCKMKSIILPAELIEIGNGAFKDCVNLESIELPGALAKIGTNIFEGCGKLMKVKVMSPRINIDDLHLPAGCNIDIGYDPSKAQYGVGLFDDGDEDDGDGDGKVKILKCTICFAKMRDPSANKALACAHVFHKACIDQWVVKESTCPMCRSKVN